MKIQELFIKPIDRPIEGVIKADDDRNLHTELDEYVVTAEVSKSLSDFADRYLNETSANGVWISGFFGSGKSHLLKMLSLLLDQQPLPDGTRPSAVLLPKIEDAILQGDLQRVVRIPSHSILFNIDQKSDAIGGDQGSPVLDVFVKVLDEYQGYYAKQKHIAQFEYDLDTRGQLAPFKAAYARISGRAWEVDLPVIETLENETFAQVYAEFFSKSYDEGLKLFDRMRDNYKLSIEGFAKRVRDYIDKQPPGFRLNFFVDEAGQFIGQDSKLMLNLQTIAESLSTVCQGRAWVFVTSQGNLQSVLGELRGAIGQDFTKIQGRFKTRLTLTSADVREVIQKRLLAKTETEPAALLNIYNAERENLQTLYRFVDGSVEYKGWRGSDEFCAYYPFVPYQFDLFQRAIEQLSGHSAFTGKHTAVGERSMLGVFQEVAKQLRNEEVGCLATFDLMYEGIAATLQGNLQTALRQAEKQLSNPLSVRILKALFLLKWVREFKPTPRNIAILLIDRPNINITQHEKAVREALNLLESQSYLQRNGEQYEFLTDLEKDIEVEIKNTDVDGSELPKLLSEVLFSDVLHEPKIRYEGNKQDYTYARKLDDQLMGKDFDIAVNIITPEHNNYGELAALAAQSMSRSNEMMVVLPANDKLIVESRLYLKTNKYIQQNMGASADETRKSILTQRGQQNSLRRTELRNLGAELLGRAPLYVNGSVQLIGEGEARNRLSKGYQSLIAVAYPKLKMLKGSYDDAMLADALLRPDDLLSGGQTTLTEAENEVLTYVRRNQDNGGRAFVDEIVREFGRRPYGWYPLATLMQLARLFRMGKIELRMADLLDAKAALEALRNSRQHGNIRVRLQEQFDAGAVNALKRWHQKFFGRINETTEPRAVGQTTLQSLAAEAAELQTLLDQAGRYAFLRQLQPALTLIRSVSEKEYAYPLNQLKHFADELLEAKDDLLTPIKNFMHGQQRQTYDSVVAFYHGEEANFAELSADDLAPVKALLDAPAPFRGNVLPSAKAAVDKLRTQIAGMLSAARQQAKTDLDAQEARLRALPDFAQLTADQRAQVLQRSEAARREIESARFISAIRDRLARYAAQDYPEQMTLASKLAIPPPPPLKTGSGIAAPVATPTPAAAIYVPVSALRPNCSLPYIATAADLDTWLAALRAAAEAELAKGNRISL